MRFLNAATRRLIDVATTAHIKSLGVTVSAADRKVRAAARAADNASVASLAAARAYRAAVDNEAVMVKSSIAIRCAANEEIAGLRRGVSL